MISPLYDVAGKAVLVVVLGAASLYAVNCVCELGATWRQCEEEVDEYRKKKANERPIVGFVNGQPCYSSEEMAIYYEQIREESVEQMKELSRSLYDPANFDHFNH